VFRRRWLTTELLNSIMTAWTGMTRLMTELTDWLFSLYDSWCASRTRAHKEKGEDTVGVLCSRGSGITERILPNKESFAEPNPFCCGVDVRAPQMAPRRGTARLRSTGSHDVECCVQRGWRARESDNASDWCEPPSGQASSYRVVLALRLPMCVVHARSVGEQEQRTRRAWEALVDGDRDLWLFCGATAFCVAHRVDKAGSTSCVAMD